VCDVLKSSFQAVFILGKKGRLMRGQLNSLGPDRHHVATRQKALHCRGSMSRDIVVSKWTNCPSLEIATSLSKSALRTFASDVLFFLRAQILCASQSVYRESDRRRFHPTFASEIRGPSWWFCSPLHDLTFCFRMALKHPWVFPSKDAIKEVRTRPR
jgi:hypothetical protein